MHSGPVRAHFIDRFNFKFVGNVSIPFRRLDPIMSEQL
jgi:hypothetical protein